MNCKIPFTKDIDFEHKLYEITSISLEHEIKVEDSILKGNFIVSGDFKSHEVSVNKEAFSYVLPFEIDLAQNVDVDTIEFMIEDFTYEVIENSVLRVNIDFNVIASVLEPVQDETEETVFREVPELLEPNIDTSDVGIETLNLKENKKEEDSIILKKDDEKIQDKIMLQEEEKVDITKETEDTIIDSVSLGDDEFATYHIHMVMEGETVETICTMYNSNMGVLADYNNLENLNQGDKLIIPDKNE